MLEAVNTLVIGAGQAGLATSYYLTQQKRQHLVLEKRRVGEAWRSEKWDSFTLVTPNWTVRLPGFPYSGTEPDGYMSGAEVVAYLEAYTRLFEPPVRVGIEALTVEGGAHNFIVTTNEGVIQAENLVIATGSFQKPKIPPFAAQIAPHVTQIHSSQYRNPDALPAGAVLVVGSGQSGCQITDELYHAGRKVYFSIGSAGRAPRRYRGEDIFRWLETLGFFNRTVDKLPSPTARFAANPQASGRDGGRSINLHQFVLDGVTLVGHLKNASGSQVFFADDLKESLTRSDKFCDDLKLGVDNFILKNGLQAPSPDDVQLRAAYDSAEVTELDLDLAGISTIVWAAGYSFDYSYIHFPIFDEFGYPVQQRGVTSQPGLYFVGLQWLHTGKSSLLLGVGEDAAYIAAQIAEHDE